MITALVDTAVSFSKAFGFRFLISVDAWQRQYVFALLFALLLMIDYSCACCISALKRKISGAAVPEGIGSACRG